jgi:hypothetical protein
MRKLVLVGVLVLMSVSIWSQEGFQFEIKVKPNTTYTTQVESSTDGIIDIIADDTILEQMKASGMETPMTMQQQSNITMVSKTSTKNSDGNIAAIMTYEKVKSDIVVNGKAMNQPSPLDSMQIMGKFNSENKFEVDSIVGSSLNDQLRSTIAQTMETVQKQIDFPEEKIYVGDTFTNEIPMSIPMQGMNPMEIVVNTVYTLKKVENNIAYFDLTQALTLDTEQEAMKMSATGSGTGNCEYSIKDKWLVKYESDLPMNLSLEMNAMMSMKMKMDTQTILTVSVE